LTSAGGAEKDFLVAPATVVIMRAKVSASGAILCQL
jgi:hypothetical protein